MSDGSDAARALVLVGAGGHARELIAQVEAINLCASAGDAVRAPWTLLGLLVDDAFRGTDPVDGYPQLGAPDWLASHADVWVSVAVGDPAQRLSLARRAAAAGAAGFATLVHPRAWVAPRATLGAGCQVMAGALVNAHAQLGEHVILNLGSSVSHDCVLGHGVTLGPGARLAVDDAGAGIAESDRAKLVEPFARGSTKAEGSGLGLAIVAQAVALHHGELKIGRSRLGGARFEIVFAEPSK